MTTVVDRIDDPIFCYADPAEHAADYRELLLNLHTRSVLKGREDTPVSEEYVNRVTLERLARTIQVDSALAGNRYIMKGMTV